MPATAHVRALCCHLPTAKPTRMASNISHIRGTIIVVSTAIILVATAIVAATSIATTPELSYDCCYHFTSTNYHYAVTHIPHPHHHAKNCMYPVVYQPLTTISISISIEFFTENEWGLINHCYCYWQEWVWWDPIATENSDWALFPLVVVVVVQLAAAVIGMMMDIS